MCGIAGVWTPGGLPAPIGASAALSRMTHLIRHRGPDDAGVWVSGDHSLHLAHQRLSIQDVSALGHQPMISNSARYVIVFNGEIYNFKRLAAELSTCGSTFRGHSDTEVMLAAFDTWGIEESLKRFDGMFAFAVYDRDASELWFARDRMGEKPLYLALVDGELYFCSELKGILGGIGKKLAMDWAGFGEYFRFGYFGVEDTPFSLVKKLKPASFLRLDVTRIKQARDTAQLCEAASVYWVRPKGDDKNRLNDRDARGVLEEALSAAVADQSIADVNVGVFLSGGIDSTLVAALLQKASSQKIATYTIAFDSPAYNEAPFAKDISTYLGTNHFEIPVAIDECFDVIEKLPALLDEPFADASLIPSYLVCREARKHVTVCLSGDGGDELFGGYNRYRWGADLQRKTLYIPQSLKAIVGEGLSTIPERTLNSLYSPLAYLKSLSGAVAEKDIGSKVHKLGRALRCSSDNALYAMLLSFWQTSPITRSEFFLDLDGCLPGRFDGQRSFAEAAMACDQDLYLVCDNLFKSDRASMASSLEIRLPFLSRAVVECAARLSLKSKIHGSRSKVILRDVLYRHIPAQLMERPKMGFSVPLGQWLRKGLRGWGESFLCDHEYLRSVGLNPEVVDFAWREHQSEKADHANALWVVLMYLQWVRANDDYIAV